MSNYVGKVSLDLSTPSATKVAPERAHFVEQPDPPQAAAVRRYVQKNRPQIAQHDLPRRSAASIDQVDARPSSANTDTGPFDNAGRVLTTMLFTDIVGATSIAFTLGDRRWHELLLEHHALVRRAIDRYRGREVDNAGDGFFATFDGPGRAVDCAHRICAEVQSLGLAVRAGLHTGECEIIGEKPGGIAVHIASRIVAEASAGKCSYRARCAMCWSARNAHSKTAVCEV